MLRRRSRAQIRMQRTGYSGTEQGQGSELRAQGSGQAQDTGDGAAGSDQEAVPGFRKPGDAATLPELIKFLIDRTGYIRSLEEEGDAGGVLAD